MKQMAVNDAKSKTDSFYGTKPEWVAINVLQKMFMKFFNKLRTKQILTFPVNYSAA